MAQPKNIVKLYYIYVIEDIISHSWYIGFSTDVERRVNEHNQKIGGKYTSKYGNKWRLIYLEGYLNKKDVLGREKYLKSGSGRAYLKKQLSNYIQSS